MVLHAGDYCAPFALRPFEEASMSLAGVFGRNDGDTQGPRARRRRRDSAPSCSSRRTASSSAAQRILLVHDIGDVQPRSIEAHEHRRARLHAPAGDEAPRRHADRESRARRAAGSTARRRPRSSTSTRSKVEFLTPRRRALDDMTAAQPDPDHRLRLAVHAAHRAARARGARLLRDPSADAHASSGSATGSRRASS